MPDSTLNWPPSPQTACPKNGFGKGENYTAQTAQEHEQLLVLWDAWESEHPDDSDGSDYIEEYEKRLFAMGKRPEANKPIPPPLSLLEQKREKFSPRGPGRPRIGKPGDASRIYIRLRWPPELYKRVQERCADIHKPISEVSQDLFEQWLA